MTYLYWNFLICIGTFLFVLELSTLIVGNCVLWSQDWIPGYTFLRTGQWEPGIHFLITLCLWPQSNRLKYVYLKSFLHFYYSNEFRLFRANWLYFWVSVTFDNIVFIYVDLSIQTVLHFYRPTRLYLLYSLYYLLVLSHCRVHVSGF